MILELHITLIVMWPRYLIEGATGVYTGSVFHDQRIQKEGHHGEFRCLKIMKVKMILFQNVLFSGPPKTDPPFYRSHIITRWCFYCICVIMKFWFWLYLKVKLPFPASAKHCWSSFQRDFFNQFYVLRWTSQKWCKHFYGEKDTSTSLEDGPWWLSGIRIRRSSHIGTFRYVLTWWLGLIASTETMGRTEWIWMKISSSTMWIPH